MFLTEISQTFPALAPSLVKTQFELLLLLEVALLQGAAVNVVAFFPTWVRSAVKKSFFKVSAGASKGEQVPRQLQQKRRKVSLSKARKQIVDILGNVCAYSTTVGHEFKLHH